MAAGRYPEARARAAPRRWRFFESYVDTLMQRDLSTIARVHDQANVQRLLAGVAAISGSLLSADRLSRDVGLAANTLRSHVDLLETLFLVTRLAPWHSNRLSRAVKTPKAYITDTGLLTYLLGVDERRLAGGGEPVGSVAETFVVDELQRQSRWQPDPPALFHYRDRESREVDVVLERRDGSIAGVEVKAAASATPRDFRGLRYLRDKLGTRFKAGVLLYTGETTVPFGDRLAAVPLGGLWEERTA